MRPNMTLLFCLMCLPCSAESPQSAHKESHQSAHASEDKTPKSITFESLNLHKELKVEELPIDVDKRLPDRIKELINKPVTITGWMYPPNQEEGLSAFLLVSGPMLTNFGAPIHADAKIVVKMKTGSTTDYVQGRPFHVTGVLKQRTKVLDGELFLLYVIEDAVITEDETTRRDSISIGGRQ